MNCGITKLNAVIHTEFRIFGSISTRYCGIINNYACLRSKPRYRYGHLWYVVIRSRLAISEVGSNEI